LYYKLNRKHQKQKRQAIHNDCCKSTTTSVPSVGRMLTQNDGDTELHCSWWQKQ